MFFLDEKQKKIGGNYALSAILYKNMLIRSIFASRIHICDENSSKNPTTNNAKLEIFKFLRKSALSQGYIAYYKIGEYYALSANSTKYAY